MQLRRRRNALPKVQSIEQGRTAAASKRVRTRPQSSDRRLKTTGRNAYIRTMPSKHIELPPQVAKAFVRDMRAFFKAKDLKRDEIASRQLRALVAFQRPRDKRLRLVDVKRMFQETKDQA
jgi:hypothetical protein